MPTKSKNRCPVCGGREWIRHEHTDRNIWPGYTPRMLWRKCLVDADGLSLRRCRRDIIFYSFDECAKCKTVVS